MKVDRFGQKSLFYIFYFFFKQTYTDSGRSCDFFFLENSDIGSIEYFLCKKNRASNFPKTIKKHLFKMCQNFKLVSFDKTAKQPVKMRHTRVSPGCTISSKIWIWWSKRHNFFVSCALSKKKSIVTDKARWLKSFTTAERCHRLHACSSPLPISL